MTAKGTAAKTPLRNEVVEEHREDPGSEKELFFRQEGETDHEAEKDMSEREAMKMKKQKRIIALAVMLCLMIACLGILTANAGKTNVSLNVSLYREIPDYDSFEETVRASDRSGNPRYLLSAKKQRI